jgi:hypothetical protein
MKNKSSASAVLGRIDKRLTALGISDNAAGAQSGLSRDFIRTLRRNVKSDKQRGISTESLEKLAPTLKTTAEWLAKASGPESVEDEETRKVVPIGQEFLSDAEIDFSSEDDILDHENLKAATRAARRELRPGEVVERDVTGGLGGAGIASEIIVEGKVVDKVRATWRLPVDYLRTELRARENDVDIIAVDGDSMTPTLLPGDRVMINRQQRRPSPDGLYAINDGLGVVVKRLEVMVGTSPLKVVVKSDNPQHGQYEQLAAEVAVIGRVICKVTRL